MIEEEERALEWCGIDELRSKLAQRRLRHYVREIEPRDATQ